MITSGLSGNEIYCLNEIGFKPGELLVGNSVYSLGLFGSVASGFKSFVGGEIPRVTSLISQGRHNAVTRMEAEASQRKAYGVTGVTSNLIQHPSNIEFLSLGSAVHHAGESEKLTFSSSIDGEELYCNHDAGYEPNKFVFGNIVYSVGLGRGIVAGLKTLVRGEIKEYSDIFNKTRHIALERIVAEAKAVGSNSVLNITTKILPYSPGVTEMLMTGTASTNPALPESCKENPVSSDLSSSELWSLTKMGYMPVKLVLGTAVYSLGLVGGLTSWLKSFGRGEIPELTSLIYQAREHAINLIQVEAESLGADMVMGTKTYMYQLGNGLIEFLAIGTAMKKTDVVKTKSDQLISQAIIQDTDSYFDSAGVNFGGGRSSI
jgi:uncharacterized protein YbjQ (UPF0145 family)